MPTVRVEGLPRHLVDNKGLAALMTEGLPQVVARVLDLEDGDVTVRTPHDLAEYPHPRIEVNILNLFVLKNRTNEVLTALADAILGCVVDFANACVPNYEWVEVYVPSIHHPEGFVHRIRKRS